MCRRYGRYHSPQHHPLSFVQTFLVLSFMALLVLDYAEFVTNNLLVLDCAEFEPDDRSTRGEVAWTKVKRRRSRREVDAMMSVSLELFSETDFLSNNFYYKRKQTIATSVRFVEAFLRD